MTMSTNITDALHFVPMPAKYSTSICRTALFKSNSICGAELVGEVVQYENVYRLCTTSAPAMNLRNAGMAVRATAIPKLVKNFVIVFTTRGNRLVPV